MCEIYIVRSSVVGDVEVVGLGRVFGSQRVDLLDDRGDAALLAVAADLQHIGLDLVGLAVADRTGQLEVRETALFRFADQFIGHVGDTVVLFELALDADDVFELLEEPFVDPGQLVDAFDRVALFERVGDHEDAFVGGMRERLVDVDAGERLVRDEPVHALSDHAQPFLDHLFEAAPDGHHLADRFHAGAQLARDAFELAEIPARNLADDVVESRFEAGGRTLRDGVFQFVQPVAEPQFRGDEGERVTGGLRRERRRAAQARVHFDHAVIFRVGVECVLNVALADDPDVADDLDRQFSQFMVFGVRKGLRRGYDDALAGVDAQRVEVFHVADGDAVVVAVPHYLVFHLFPAFERFLDQDLRRVGERLAGERIELLVVVAEA